MRIGGRYDPIDDEEAQELEDFANLLLDAIDEMELSNDEHKTKYLIQFYLDAISVISRCFPQYKQEAANCMLDVYYEMGELDRCTELVGEIDKIIEDSKDYRIYRDVDPNLRRILFSAQA